MAADVFIGLGSNLRDPVQQVSQAVNKIEKLKQTTVISFSSLYETPPMGPQDQPNYINAVVKITTALTPHDLLIALQAIEQQHNRTRDTGRWGARTLDLDILIYEGYLSQDPQLTLPHPGLHKRNFVLYPLMEIDHLLDIPTLGSIQQLVKQLNEPTPKIVSTKSLDK